MSFALNLFHATELASMLASGRGGIKERLKRLLTDPAGQRALFASLRAFATNLATDKTLITAYPCDGTVIFSRADDVREVLDRQGDFEVVYEPKMRRITGGVNFFLGMQDDADYQRDTSIMRKREFPHT